MKLLDTAGVSTLWGKVKDHVKTSIDSQQFKTINGTSVKGAGDIHIDLTLYKVVSALPTSGIDATKIYLVKDSSVDGNLYSEYMYVDSKWEKLGSFRSSVDLEPYAKTDYVNTKLSTKVDKESGKGLSTNDFTTAEKNKLANISAGANNYSLPLATSNVRGGAKIGYTTNSSNRNYAVQLSNEQMYVNVPWTDTNTTYGLATSTNDGLMKASDKAKIDNIDTTYAKRMEVVGLDGIEIEKIPQGSFTVQSICFPNVNKGDSVNITFESATTSMDGFMSKNDKHKLDEITTITDTELKSILV